MTAGQESWLESHPAEDTVYLTRCLHGQGFDLVHNDLSSRAVALLHSQQHRLPLFCIQRIKGANTPAPQQSQSMTIMTRHHNMSPSIQHISAQSGKAHPQLFVCFDSDFAQVQGCTQTAEALQVHAG